MMAAADPRNGRYLTASALFRGNMATKVKGATILKRGNILGLANDSSEKYFIFFYSIAGCRRRDDEGSKQEQRLLCGVDPK